MTNLSNVLTPEQRTREKGYAAVVVAVCVMIGINLGFAAVSIAYPKIGELIGFLCVGFAIGLVGFEVGRRFERNNNHA